MGNKYTRGSTNTNQDNANQQPCTLTSQQARTLQRLFSRGSHPDTSLLPYQMKRMKIDAPPKTKENSKTIRMKNICYLNKKTFSLKNIINNKYIITFQYSTTLNIYCSIYLFTNEITDKYNCTKRYQPKYKRNIFDCIHNDIDDNKDDNNYNGSTYLLPKGYNLTFEQSCKDFMDLDAINYQFYQINPALQYYPIVVVFSRKQPPNTLLCINKKLFSDVSDLSRNVNEKRFSDLSDIEKNKILNSQLNDDISYITSLTSYGKLILKNDNKYDTEIISQKTIVGNRSFESQDIYGLDRRKDPYSFEENLCVICMTIPRDTALCPCRHLCLCTECAKQLLKRSNKCPVCRAYVSETIKISRNKSSVNTNSNPLL